MEDRMLNQQDSRGYTAMMQAVRGNRREVIALFLQYETDLRTSTPTGLTALKLAVKNGFLDCVKMLIEGGDDVNQSSPIPARTPLAKFDLDSENGAHVCCAAHSLHFGADHQSDSPSKWAPPLVYAAQFNRFEVAQYLLKKGAVFDFEDRYFTCIRDDNIRKLLFAAGDVRILRHPDFEVHNLQGRCRECIRTHLLSLNRGRPNLFVRVSELGLPQSLIAYVLFDLY